jgi:carbonic anhydrase
MTTPGRRRVRTQIAGIVIAALLVVGAALAASVSAGPSVTFSYSGDSGPGFWAELDPANWEACAGGGGSRQSPIDISRVRIDRSLTRLNLNLTETPIALINNGHTIEEEYEAGSSLTFKGVTYHLQQFHFHALSEHTVGGRRGVMELHLVFKDDLVATTKIAVVGMLYKSGHKNAFLAKLIAGGLPMKEGQRVDSPVELNVADGLTDTAAYYRYAGSLTTPPCTENVTWLVLKKPAELSPSQFQTIDKVLGDNFRPLQKRNGRVVWATARGGKGRAH